MKLLLTLLFLSTTTIFAQSILKGRVLQKNGKPIYLANIYIEGTYDGGGTTDSLGNFTFETNEQGAKTIKASVVGRPLYSKLIKLPHKELLIIQLQGSENRLQEVNIQAGVLQANSSGKNTVMSPLDIVTTAGSMGNIISALATLPGAQVAGENGRLMVHGGDASETQTYINGIRVAQPYTASPEAGIQIDLQINPDENNGFILPLSLQLLIENVIKHNIISIKKPLLLKIYRKNNYLYVENNLQKKKVLYGNSGIGLKNIQKRYAILSDLPVHVLESDILFSVGLPIINEITD